MGIISDVKCGRCDRRYSGLRSRCPYCGARRGKRGKHADDSDNSKAKILIGSLLILVLIVAVVVLIITSAKGRSEGDVPNDQNTPAQGDEPLVNGGDAGTNPDNTGDDGNDAGGTDGSQEPGAGDDGNTGGGTDANTGDGSGGSDTSSGDGDKDDGTDKNDDKDDDDDTNKPPAGSTVTSVSITSIYSSGELTDFTMSSGDSIQLDCETVPAETTEKASWSSDDTSVFTVTSDGLVTAVGSGVATLTVKVGGATAECTVRVN
jgi:hypothetical protein